jgi:hypothetical protein
MRIVPGRFLICLAVSPRRMFRHRDAEGIPHEGAIGRAKLREE